MGCLVFLWLCWMWGVRSYHNDYLVDIILPREICRKPKFVLSRKLSATETFAGAYECARRRAISNALSLCVGLFNFLQAISELIARDAEQFRRARLIAPTALYSLPHQR